MCIRTDVATYLCPNYRCPWLCAFCIGRADQVDGMARDFGVAGYCEIREFDKLHEQTKKVMEARRRAAQIEHFKARTAGPGSSETRSQRRAAKRERQRQKLEAAIAAAQRARNPLRRR